MYVSKPNHASELQISISARLLTTSTRYLIGKLNNMYETEWLILPALSQKSVSATISLLINGDSLLQFA